MVSYISRMLWTIMASLLIWLCSVSSVTGAEIRTGIINFPPFYVVNDNGKHSGLCLDILVATLKKAKLDYNINPYPPMRLFHNLNIGKTDLFLGIKGSPEYDEQVYYSKTPISHIQLRVYATGNTPLPRVKEDLIGKSLIAIRGYGYDGLINYLVDPENKIDVMYNSQHKSSFLMLKNKRAEYLLDYKHPADRVLQELVVPDLKYVNLNEVELFFIVSKKSPNALQLMDKLETAYSTLLEEGLVSYIDNK